MLGCDEVFLKVSEIWDIEEEDREKIKSFCQSAAAQMNERIKPGADTSDIRILTAAAAVALHDYFCVKNVSDSDFDSFKAGDVTVSKSSENTSKAVSELKRNAMTAAAPLLDDTEFLFKTI